jgi:polyhydroxyalkanoate synthesis regulator phasin
MGQAKPGQKIADLVAAGQLDAAGALAAVQDQMGAMLPDMQDGMDMGEMDPMQQAEADRQAMQDMEARKSRIQALGHRLYSLAKSQVALRQATEERWYADVRQFNGQYDAGMFASEDAAGEQPYGSRVFVPLTRRLVNLCEARLFDMLFQA